MIDERRFYEDVDPDNRCRSAPAVARNREPIAEVLAQWLPTRGLVLEIASGTGEHALAFARRFADLEWQPSDPDPLALASIKAWQRDGPVNLHPPIKIDAAAPDWPIDYADAILCINMVHISPWASTLGLLDGAAHLLAAGAPLILYGPWILDGVVTAPSNLEFDADLKSRDERWGLRSLTAFRAEAEERGLMFEQSCVMPANNVMLSFRRTEPPAA
ncbi:MAG: class I SAM-dependent methyltransferase [Sphingomonas bacterium]|nr:class I SAM-dependent methyltransferase [Sphingomonas bacterium]